jgi:hypothetical protein
MSAGLLVLANAVAHRTLLADPKTIKSGFTFKGSEFTIEKIAAVVRCVLTSLTTNPRSNQGVEFTLE